MLEEAHLPQENGNPEAARPEDRPNPGDDQADRPAEESVVEGRGGDRAGGEGPPKTKFERLSERLGLLAQAYTSRTNRLESYLQIVVACQKQAAEFANHVLERHALHPAVETVDLLAGLIGQLYEQANALVEAGTHCPMFEPLLDAIAEAAKMAQAKREYLDIESICPAPRDNLDIDKHEIRQVAPTDDPDKHKKVERTLIPGLVYRGAVLRRAKVSVYRHVENERPNRKDNP